LRWNARHLQVPAVLVVEGAGEIAVLDRLADALHVQQRLRPQRRARVIRRLRRGVQASRKNLQQHAETDREDHERGDEFDQGKAVLTRRHPNHFFNSSRVTSPVNQLTLMRHSRSPRRTEMCPPVEAPSGKKRMRPELALVCSLSAVYSTI